MTDNVWSLLYEDAHCLAVVKPPGQFTQGSWAPPGRDHAGNSGPAVPRSGRSRLRLSGDRPPARPPDVGTLVWAKTPKAARRLSSQFERRRVVKEYWAVVEVAGTRQPDTIGSQEIWTDWLTRADARGCREHCAAACGRCARGDYHRPFRGDGCLTLLDSPGSALASDRQDAPIAGTGVCARNAHRG